MSNADQVLREIEEQAEKEQHLDYLKLLESKLREGSVVVADNAKHAPQYLGHVRESGKYKSQFIPARGASR